MQICTVLTLALVVGSRGRHGPRYRQHTRGLLDGSDLPGVSFVYLHPHRWGKPRPWADLEPLGAAGKTSGAGAGGCRKSAARRLDRVRCSAAPLDVAVVGGSMTYGVLCNEKAAAGGAGLDCPWPLRVARRAATAAGNGTQRVVVHNLAISATCTGCVTAQIVPRLAALAPNASVVLFDYGINDEDAHKAVYHQGNFRDLRGAATEVFIREILSMDRPPVIVVIEGRAPVGTHRAVATGYDLDVISYRDAIRALPVTASYSQRIRWTNTKMMSHPPATVHTALGDLIYAILSTRPGDCDEISAALPPLPKLLFPADQRAMFPTCGTPLAFLTSAPPGTTPAGAEAMLGAPAAVGASWRFTAADAGDRADKFGWLGVKGKEGTSSADRISFRLEFSGLGFLAFEFLRSYAWDGRVSIIIDGKRPLLDLGSHWEDQSSQRVTNYLALGTSKNINVGHGRSKLTNRITSWLCGNRFYDAFVLNHIVVLHAIDAMLLDGMAMRFLADGTSAATPSLQMTLPNCRSHLRSVDFHTGPRV